MGWIDTKYRDEGMKIRFNERKEIPTLVTFKGIDDNWWVKCEECGLQPLGTGYCAKCLSIVEVKSKIESAEIPVDQIPVRTEEMPDDDRDSRSRFGDSKGKIPLLRTFKGINGVWYVDCQRCGIQGIVREEDYKGIKSIKDEIERKEAIQKEYDRVAAVLESKLTSRLLICPKCKSYYWGINERVKK